MEFFLKMVVVVVLVMVVVLGGGRLYFSALFLYPLYPHGTLVFTLGGGLDGCCDVWCSFDTFEIEFSLKDEKKLRIFGKIFFGNVTQHCIGKCSQLLGK